MAVYLIAMVGDEPLARLHAQPEEAGLPGEVEAAAEYNDFWLHVMWPEEDEFRVLIEGDGDPAQVVSLLTQRVAGGGWNARIEHKPEAEEPPADLEAGEQDRWVIETAVPSSAVPPEGRRCRFCQRAAVPPHAESCIAAKTDPGQALDRPTARIGDEGGSAVSTREERERTEAW